jgi:dTDP-4-amino-4,6-dideoxygalactose transaminase
MNVPFLSFEHIHRPIKGEIMQAFESFYDSEWYILGERLSEFEEKYSQFNQVENCIGVSNGLDALHLALKALGVGPGDEVIVPANTYIATPLAVSYVGATPVFVEPNISTYNLNPTAFEAAISSKTKAVMPVHLYGQACEMTPIIQIAKKHGIFIVEDNAQAQGARYNGKITGSFGHVNGTSFYPGKNLGALGDAGAVTTNDAKIAEKIKILRNYGSQNKYYNETIGFNMRMDECQAAMLSVKLQYLELWTQQRREIASWYDEYLSGVGDLILPTTALGATHVYHLYVVRTNRRNELQDFLKSRQIGTLIHYPIPPHLQEAYSSLGYKSGDFPIAEEIANTGLSLPLWPGMTQEVVERVSRTIMKFYAG